MKPISLLTINSRTASARGSSGTCNPARGRPHPIYLVGLLSLATGLWVPVIGRSDAWLTNIDHLVNWRG